MPSPPNRSTIDNLTSTHDLDSEEHVRKEQNKVKLCADCSTEYNEEFKFCPECGRPFGGVEAQDMKKKLDQHLLDMKRQAGSEAALSRRVFSGQGFGDANIGPIYGRHNEDSDL